LLSVLLFVLIIGVLLAIFVIREEKGAPKYIACFGFVAALLLNLVTAVFMGQYVSVVKENGGSYSFFKSLAISSYWGETPDEIVTYRKVDNEDLTVSVYKNSNGGKNLPVYVYIHGGGWTNNNSETASALHRYFADNGYVGFSVNYRLGTLEKPTWDKAIDDCAFALLVLDEPTAGLGWGIVIICC